MFDSLRRDAVRYVQLGGWYRNLGFYVGATYRFGAWAHSFRYAALRVPLMALYYLVRLPWRLFFNVQIDPAARIGPGLCLIHPHSVLIPATEVGRDCLVFHEVTIGTNICAPEMPKIGNGVDIYVGARVLGDIVVGDHAKIGANCVVTSNVPAGAVVVPAPNRVVPPKLVEAISLDPGRARHANSAGDSEG